MILSAFENRLRAGIV